jgi:glycosyltransferase involved in cell wall biosynthesis
LRGKMVNKEINMLVTVCVVSYNHEKYIRQCIESIINQKTNFDFEVLISDDFSTDKTREILKEYESKENNIKIFYQDVNIGAEKNIYFIHTLARGKYVCHVDGDDWLLPNKLQKQYNEFQKNENLVAIWHMLERYTEEGKKISESNKRIDVEKYFNIELRDILSFGSIGGASSIMYQRKFHPGKLTKYDFDLVLELLKNGNGLLMNDFLGAYRVSSQLSMTKSLIQNNLNHLRRHQLKSLVNFSKSNNISFFYIGIFSIYSILAMLKNKEKLSTGFLKNLIYLMSPLLVTELPKIILKRIRIQLI